MASTQSKTTKVTLRLQTPSTHIWPSPPHLTGSTPHLGNWGAEPPFPLNPTTESHHEITLHLPPHTTFEYKYVALTPSTKIIHWEQLPHPGNRRLTTPSPDHHLLIDDGLLHDDSSVTRRLIPLPNPAVLRDNILLTDHLNRTQQTLENLRNSLLPSKPPSQPPSSPTEAEIDSLPDALAIIQVCLERGHVLLRQLRALRDRQKLCGRENIRQRESGLGVGLLSVVLALLVALVALPVALRLVAPGGFVGVSGGVARLWRVVESVGAVPLVERMRGG